MGHPTAIFLHPPDPNYKCAICLDIFDDPVSLLRCGHTFCRSCLHSSLAQSGKKCPECRLQVDVGVDNSDDDDEEEDNAWDASSATEVGARNNNGNVVHSVRVIQSAIGNSMVRCRNGWLDENGELLHSNNREGGSANDNDAGANERNDNGSGESNQSEPPTSSSQQQQCCNWTGPLSQWHIHSTHHCPVAQTTCPIPGCSHTSSRHSMKLHTGSSSCIKAAVVSQVQSQMNGILSHLKRQMKKEVDRKLSVLKKEKVELEVRVQGEMERGLELQEVNYGLRREVRGLKRRVAVAEGQRRSAMQLNMAVSSSSSNGEQEEESEGNSGSDGRVARGGGRGGGDNGDGEESSGKSSGRKQQKKRAKKQRRSLSFDVHVATAASAQQDTVAIPVQRNRQRALSMDAASFMASEEQEEGGGTSRRKKRKKSKKSKRRRVSNNEPLAGNDEESGRGRAVSTDGTDVGVRISG